MTLNLNAIDLDGWLAENSNLLKPPVGNYCIQRGGFTVMIVGGPNERTDYHVNPTPEFFIQKKGPMCLRIVTPENKFETVVIREGNIYLLPANTPHSPVRFEDTVGIVVEQDRPEGQNDKMRWYCDACKEIVFEAEFYMYDLGTQVKEGIDLFNKEERKCKCGKVCHSKPENPLTKPE